MTYRVEFTPAAAREFRKLPPDAKARIAKRIDLLAEDPRPDGVKKLSDGTYRVRVGPFRILYRVRDAELLVLVIRIRDRKDAYGP